ncbi:hypothetical protein PG993_004170 [Apiospora rasikravindrae]|uniref:BED-type domain-containing protein n=1 Tax=Apiospora rasikravindrae TaxID=990691 RepID=A0ABR1TC08_9PEZI
MAWNFKSNKDFATWAQFEEVYTHRVQYRCLHCKVVQPPNNVSTYRRHLWQCEEYHQYQLEQQHERQARPAEYLSLSVIAFSYDNPPSFQGARAADIIALEEYEYRATLKMCETLLKDGHDEKVLSGDFGKWMQGQVPDISIEASVRILKRTALARHPEGGQHPPPVFIQILDPPVPVRPTKRPRS